MNWLVRSFGTKKGVAMVAGVLAVLVVLGAGKLGVTLDPSTVGEALVAVLTPVVLYLCAQWHIDVKTGGETTTAAMLTREAAGVAAKVLPSNTVGAKMADAIVKALQDDPAAAAAVAKALAAGPQMPPPSST